MDLQRFAMGVLSTSCKGIYLDQEAQNIIDWMGELIMMVIRGEFNFLTETGLMEFGVIFDAAVNEYMFAFIEGSFNDPVDVLAQK